MKITRADRAYLNAMPDWSAPYEIMHRLGRPVSFKSQGLAVKALTELVRRGLAEYGFAQNTYRALPVCVSMPGDVSSSGGSTRQVEQSNGLSNPLPPSILEKT